MIHARYGAGCARDKGQFCGDLRVRKAQQKRAGGSKMARKSTPLTLNLAPAPLDNERNYVDSSQSPLSLVSPKSPRSPFTSRFSTKKGEQQASMQASDQPQNRLTPSISNSSFHQPPTSSGGEGRQDRDKATRSGFFSNYKASKSSSHLQPRDAPNKKSEDSMSRDSDRPTMSGKVSASDAMTTGKTHSVSSHLLICMN